MREVFQIIGNLQTQFTWGTHHDRLHVGQFGVQTLNERNAESAGLARSCRRFRDDISALHQNRDRLFLNGGRHLEPHFFECLFGFGLQIQRCEPL